MRSGHLSYRIYEDKAGGPGAVAALRRAVDKYGDAPDAAYASCFPFELDEYQIEAFQHLRNDSNVIVSAPTGSGKTVAGELAIAYALAQDKRVLYTTPLKACRTRSSRTFVDSLGVRMSDYLPETPAYAGRSGSRDDHGNIQKHAL